VLLVGDAVRGLDGGRAVSRIAPRLAGSVVGALVA
jgi:hypothetical protein